MASNYKVVERNGKRIKYHRWIVEQFLGRKLRVDEIVHHIDENPFNNDISNLRILTSSEHTSLHTAGKPIKGHKAYNKLKWYKIQRILKLWDNGMKNYSKIAYLTNLSDTVVKKYIMEYGVTDPPIADAD